MAPYSFLRLLITPEKKPSDSGDITRNHRYVQNRLIVNCIYQWQCVGGQHLFLVPSIDRHGHYSDITSRGVKGVERERSDYLVRWVDIGTLARAPLNIVKYLLKSMENSKKIV
jgi:hypothetical protein